jgi:ferredoxin
MGREAGAQVLLVVCGHQPGTPPPEGVSVEVVPQACGFPERLTRLLCSHPADRGVLALCGAPGLPDDVRVALRNAGKDPEAFFVLDPRGDRAHLQVRAAVARVRAWPGLVSANLAPYLPERLSRRTLLRFAPVAYRVVPRVDRDLCRAGEGCDLCEASCPAQAIRVSGGKVALERTQCTGCGACVDACPHDALVFPGHTGAEVAAQVEALLDPSVGPAGPRGIAYVCAGSPPDPTWHAAWLPVPVPCVSHLPVSWILAPLLLGAASVAVAPCTCGTGRSDGQGREDRVEFCRAYADAVGLGDRVHRAALSVGPREGQALPACGQEARTLFGTGPEATARVLQLLADLAGAQAPRLEHPASPLGLVEVDPGTCTGCGMCAAHCPTSALSFAQGEEVTLRWDPARCVGCGRCTEVCPEVGRGAVGVRRAVDVGELRRGTRTVYREDVVRCVVCGAPVAPRRMVQRVVDLLGEEGRVWEGVLSRYCAGCRAIRGSQDGTGVRA